MNIKLIADRRELTLVTVWIYIPAVVVLASAAAFSYIQDIPISKFMRDPAAITESNPLYGFVSNMGALFWCAATSMCFLTYGTLRASSEDRTSLNMIALGGLWSLVLLFDDFFLFHDRIFPDYLDIKEKQVFIVYMLLFAAWLFAFRTQILKTSLLYLGIALAGFSLAILIDHRIPEGVLPWHHLYEDGFKFLGVASWSGYFFTVCRQSLKASIAEHRTRGQ